MRHAIANASLKRMPLHMPETSETCKNKSMPCLIQKVLRYVADHTSKTSVFFIFHFLLNKKIFQENHVCLFSISLVQW